MHSFCCHRYLLSIVKSCTALHPPCKVSTRHLRNDSTLFSSKQKDVPVTYTDFEDPCFGGGEERVSKTYMHIIVEWWVSGSVGCTLSLTWVFHVFVANWRFLVGLVCAKPGNNVDWRLVCCGFGSNQSQKGPSGSILHHYLCRLPGLFSKKFYRIV